MHLSIRQPIPEGSRHPHTTIFVIATRSDLALPECLDRIHRHTDLPYRLVVITDSAGGTRGDPPIGGRVHRIQHDAQDSVGQTIQRAFESFPDEQTTVLSADHLVTPHWLRRLTERLQALPTVAAIGPVTDGGMGEQQLTRHLDAIVCAHVTPEARAALLADRYRGETLLTYWLSLACVLIPARTLRRIGAPDPGFRGRGRDLEYALRCRQHGLRLAIARDVYVPSAPGRLGEERTPIADSQDSLRLRQQLAATYGPEAAPACHELWGDVTLAQLGLTCSIQGGHPECAYATAKHVAGAVLQ
jgi:Glycosyltransferase like family 2